jgi:uncharacterized protein (TIGR02147 family)
VIFSHENYRTYLKSVLAERIASNPLYSLRAMAKTFELSPSQLSRVLSGEKNLSYPAAIRCGQKLGLNESEADYFSLLVQYELTKDPQARNAIARKLAEMNDSRQFDNLELDEFRAISEWYHLPILEMTRLRPFVFSAGNIARRLGISTWEAQAAIDRLQRIGLLERAQDGSYRKLKRNPLISSDSANQGLRSFHKQMLEKAIQSIESQTPQEKFIGSETFSIDPSRLEDAKKLIEKCFSQVSKLFAKDESRTEAYHMGIQLFRLTSKRKTA